MAEIIKAFRENIPTMRFIGKKYDNFGHWGEWWQNGWFDLLEQTMGGTDKILAIRNICYRTLGSEYRERLSLRGLGCD